MNGGKKGRSFGSTLPKQQEGEGKRAPLIGRRWVQVLVVVWVLGIIVMYFRLQIGRVLEVAGR